jgi:predicted porin
MKKTLIASAIAAISFSGAAAAQSTISAAEMAAKMDSMPSVYGNIQYALIYENIDKAASSIDHIDNGSTLGVKHEHMIAPGVAGFFKLELDGFNADDKKNGRGQGRIDEAYIGVKSDSFGQVWVGTDDSTYERAVAKIANFHEIGTGLDGSYTTGEGDQIQYVSPSFGGLTLGGAVQVNGDNGTGGKSYPYQLAAIYSVDALELAFAMDSNDGSTGYSSKTVETIKNNENTYGLRATYTMGDMSVTGEYQTRKDVKNEFGVIGVYALGANQFSLAYQVVEDDTVGATNGDKEDVIALQALHNLSDNMYVYTEAFFYSNDADYGIVAGSDQKQVAAVGAVYYF